MRKLLLSFMLMLSFFMLPAQSMTSALKTYLLSNGGMENIKNDQLRSALIMVTPNLENGIPDGYTAESLVDAYMNGQMLDDFASMLMPYIADEGVTVAQIEELNALLKTPEGATAVANSIKMNTPEALADMMAVMNRDIMKLITSEEVNVVKTSASPERQQLFKGYYSQCGINEMLPNVFRAALAGQSIPDEIVQRMNKYFELNLETLVLNASEGIVTDDDLRFWTKLVQYPQYAQIVKGVNNAMGEPENLGLTIVTQFLDWAKKMK